jgi:hypothetical protein
MIKELTLTSKQMLNAARQSELLSAVTSRTQPTTEKLRSYQQPIAHRRQRPGRAGPHHRAALAEHQPQRWPMK